MALEILGMIGICNRFSGQRCFPTWSIWGTLLIPTCLVQEDMSTQRVVAAVSQLAPALGSMCRLAEFPGRSCEELGPRPPKFWSSKWPLARTQVVSDSISQVVSGQSPKRTAKVLQHCLAWASFRLHATQKPAWRPLCRTKVATWSTIFDWVGDFYSFSML